MMRKLSPHSNIVSLQEVAEVQAQDGQPGDKDIYILMEYCPGGTLFDLIQKYSVENANKGI